MQHLKILAAELLQLLFPSVCNGCGQPLVKSEQLICLSCRFDLPYTDFHLYPDNPVAKQLWGRIPCAQATAMLYFKKGTRVQQLLHNLKYKGKPELGVLLGELLAETILQSSEHWEIDLILPVPLHKKRERTRGYNQSMCIAEGLSAGLHLPVYKNVLVKRSSTSSQTKKSRFSRFENLKSAFSIEEEEKVKGKHVLLVDDVITTGATIEACASALNFAGIASLSVAAIAYTK
ncbi:ComF family protein [Pedobacter sp. SAFR-022]|uniref:ComF family protein n=1 Tax=Pedobacter sp. SAFR-022 TaxID=3436861 RepID=UPI003F810731